MVRKTVWAIAVMVLATVVSVSAKDVRKVPDGDDLRKRLHNAEIAHSKRDQEVKFDQMHRLYRVISGSEESVQGEAKGNRPASPASGEDMPVQESGNDPDHSGINEDGRQEGRGLGPQGNEGNVGQPPVSGDAVASEEINSSNGSERPTQKGRGAHVPSATSAPSGPLGQRDRYIPPSWSVLQGSGSFDTDQVKQKGQRFGIHLGTRINGEIRRVVTNVERNLCEIYVTQDVVGDRRNIPKGSVLFADKSLNMGTKRLEFATVKGITPDKTEFVIKAYVMDVGEMAGLSGAISTDGKTVQRSVSKGAYAVGRQMVSALNDGSVVGAGVEAATDNALGEKETETDKTLGEPQYTITVPPQKVILRVEQTF